MNPYEARNGGRIRNEWVPSSQCYFLLIASSSVCARLLDGNFLVASTHEFCVIVCLGYAAGITRHSAEQTQVILIRAFLLSLLCGILAANRYRLNHTTSIDIPEFSSDVHLALLFVILGIGLVIREQYLAKAVA